MPWAIFARFLLIARETMLQQARQVQAHLDSSDNHFKFIFSPKKLTFSIRTSDMVLAVHSNAGDLWGPKAQSWVGGHFFLSSDTTVSPNNGAILNIAHIIKNVISSATKAELAGLYVMARKAVYIRIILEELGHVQPPTPLQTDNAMADGVING